MNMNEIKPGVKFELQNPKVKKPGTLTLINFQVATRPSFTDYLRGGLQLNMIVAIDFTGSNGNPKDKNSLHFMSPVQPNQYQMAILGISNILMNYDYDKRIPAFGFGASPRFQGKSGPVNHCFALSGNPA